MCGADWTPEQKEELSKKINATYFATAGYENRTTLLKIEENGLYQWKVIGAFSTRKGRKPGTLRINRALKNHSQFNPNLAFGFSTDREEALKRMALGY